MSGSLASSVSIATQAAFGVGVGRFMTDHARDRFSEPISSLEIRHFDAEADQEAGCRAATSTEMLSLLMSSMAILALATPSATELGSGPLADTADQLRSCPSQRSCPELP